MIYSISLSIILILIVIYQAKRNSKLKTQRDAFYERAKRAERLNRTSDIANLKYQRFWAENHSDPNTVLDATGMLSEKSDNDT